MKRVYQHGMSYVLRIGPPKPKANLASDEGLTDALVVHSIIGVAGGPGPLSVQTIRLDVNGPGVLRDAEAFYLAAILLAQLDGRHPAATEALGVLRRDVRDRIAATAAKEQVRPMERRPTR